MRRRNRWEDLGKVLAVVGVLVLALLVFLAEREEKQPNGLETTVTPRPIEESDEGIATPVPTEEPDVLIATPVPTEEPTKALEPTVVPVEEGKTEEVIELPFVPAD